MAAVKIAAHHLNKRGGVLIGDVVGLGKTLMATALATIFQDDLRPGNADHLPEEPGEDVGGLRRTTTGWCQGRLGDERSHDELPDLRRYRLVLIDESHNLRNREGKRYRAIQEYIQKNESKCILLSATPYNKTYLDLSSQLRLFLREDKRPRHPPGTAAARTRRDEFIRRHQCAVARSPPSRRANTPTTGAN